MKSQEYEGNVDLNEKGKISLNLSSLFIDEDLFNKLQAPTLPEPIEQSNEDSLQQKVNEVFSNEQTDQQKYDSVDLSQQMQRSAGNPIDLTFEIFKLFDVDGSGQLDFRDLEEVGKALGWRKEECELHNL